ncbi:MAG: hypothetical protein ACM369_10520 [Acidobacteriota bacterium]
MKISRTCFAVVLTALILGAGLAVAAPATKAPTSKKPATTQDVRALTRQYIAWSDSITLTPEQQKIKEEVLSSIPTVCCSKFSMLTCCCACNMAKTIWGLSNHLLVHDRADAKHLRSAVLQWTRLVGKSGFTGDACFKGGCARPFAENGCGGMDGEKVVF